MAISTDDPTENAAVVPEVNEEHTPDNMEPVRMEEVQALLGGSDIAENEEPEFVSDQAAENDAAPVDDVNAEEDADKEAFVTDSFSAMPGGRPDNTLEEHPAKGSELTIILESLQDSLASTQNISSKIDALSNDTDRLTSQVNSISINCELLTAEMESFTSSANTKSMLSKTFLIISSVALALLVIFQIYTFFSLVETQRLQYAAGSAVLKNISGLNKKMADYDNHLTKALEQPAQKEHAQPNTAEAVKAGHETPGNKEVGSASVTSVPEKLNRLRNGLPERKLIRKETGDWFVYNNKKSEESISDVEVIEVLNQAYRRIGRSLAPTVPTPPHNALCILKPDGKGGTEVVMTKDFLQENDVKPEVKKKSK
jgi:hypothetical protein